MLESRIRQIIVGGLLFLSCPLGFGSTVVIQFRDEDERVMEVLLSDGLRMSDGLILYQKDGKWFLPVGQLAEALDVVIRFLPEASGVEGFIGSESRRIRFDLRDCRGSLADADISVAEDSEGVCSGVVRQDEEIFLDVENAEKWFLSKFQIDSARSRVVVEPTIQLPAQERRAREQQPKLGAAPDDRLNTNRFPQVEMDHSMWEGFLSDHQFSLGVDRPTGSNLSSSFGYSGQISGELLGFQAIAFGSFGQNGLSSAGATSSTRLSLVRQDPMGGLFGPVRASRFECVDIELPAMPSVSRPRIIRGAMISNLPVFPRRDLGRKDFSGDLAPGWEVELYQNDIFVGRQIASGQGRYLFAAVPVFYGKNRIRLVFYGPQGQRREEAQVYDVDAKSLGIGEFQYRAALGADEGQFSHSFEIRKGIGLGTSLEAATTGVALSDQSSPSQFHQLGIRTFQNGFGSSLIGTLSPGSGRAGEISIQIPFTQGSILARHMVMNRFQSEVLGANSASLKSRSELELSGAIPWVPQIQTSTAYMRDLILDGSGESSLVARQAVFLGGVLINHERQFRLSSEQADVGRVELSRMVDIGRFLVSSEYLGSQWRTFQQEFQLPVGDVGMAMLQWRKDFTTSEASLSPTFSRRFQYMTFSFGGIWSSEGGFRLNFTLSSSLSRDPAASTYHLDSVQNSSGSAASIRAFRDMNRNGVMDGGDAPLSGVGFLVNGRRRPETTDDRGRAWLGNISSMAEVTLEPVQETLEDPFLRPRSPGLRWFPRVGKTAALALPFQVQGEIEGAVVYSTGNDVRPLRGATIEARSLESGSVVSASTDREGQFYLEGLSPGEYILRVSALPFGYSPIQAAPIRIRVREEHPLQSAGTILVRKDRRVRRS